MIWIIRSSLIYWRGFLHYYEDFQSEDYNPKIRVFTSAYLDRSYNCDHKTGIGSTPVRKWRLFSLY